MTKSKRELIFKPKSGALFKKSPLYPVSMFAKTLGLCVSLLAKMAGKESDSSLVDKYFEYFSKAHLGDSHTTLYATGRENLIPGETYVFMSNHESWMDIPAIAAAVPGSLRMISKIGLMKVPILGHAMYAAGFIAIDRKNRARAIRQLGIAKERLAQGISIWIAPEGTRTRDGKIGRFKKGGFHLARDLEKPIVPVFIEGAKEVMAADSMMVTTNKTITVHFLKPVITNRYSKEQMNDLIDTVRSAIIEKQADLQSA